MAIQTQEKEINGSIYTVTQLPARRALRLKSKLIKVFGPIFAQFFIKVRAEEDSEQAQKDSIIKSIEMFSHNLDSTEFEALVMEILQGVRKSGMELTSAIVDMEFAGDMSSLYKLIWFVVEVNFANFFELLGIGNLFQSQENLEPTPTKKTFMKKS